MKTNLTLITLTREQWLTEAIFKLSHAIFTPAGYTIPQVRVSTGFTGSRSGFKAVGVHWKPAAAADNVGQIFISPLVSDSLEVLAILVHELVHATVGNEHGHGKVFKQCALKVGLTGKMTSTTASEPLKAMFKQLEMSDYPHSKLNPKLARKKQSTRMIKMICQDCGYIARASFSAIRTHGSVLCPCNNQPMEF